MHAQDFGWKNVYVSDGRVFMWDGINGNTCHYPDDETRFLTKELGVTHIEDEDNKPTQRVDKYKAMAQRRPEVFKRKWARWLMRREWGRKLMFAFFGKKKASETAFPTKFPYVKKTDQERCENMPWVLKDKTPYIVTEKCDGSSATYILARTYNPFNPFKFYVCSRNVRMLDEGQKCFYEDNVYWEMAKKYNIEEKLKDYLKNNPKLSYICWQGEICGPHIQKNPHHLYENHLFCFHMIDSAQGKYDMRIAERIWYGYNMEVVPIVNTNYRMPDDFEEFKKSADGTYDYDVCNGECAREGYVYYKTTDPNFSFKNVSREYLLKH